VKFDLGVRRMVIGYEHVEPEPVFANGVQMGVVRRSGPAIERDVRCEVEIDVEALVGPLLRRAALSKRGVSKLANGAVVVKVRK
jgi:hypothetical protein